MNIKRIATTVCVAAVLSLLAFFISNGSAHAANSTTVTLHSDFTGTATFAAGANADESMVTLKISGLPPNSTHAAHIHSGTTCAANGPVVYPLTDVAADASGTGTSTSTVKAALSAFADGKHYVNIHDMSSKDGVGNGIFCAPIPSGATSVDLAGASGTAMIIDNGNGTTEVKVPLTGFAPNTAHAGHIHSGTCAANGAVVYPLAEAMTDASGSAVSDMVINTAYDQVVSGQKYVNFHVRGANDPGSVGYGVACGDIMANAAPMPSMPNTGTAPITSTPVNGPVLFLSLIMVVMLGVASTLVLRGRIARR